MKLPTYKIIPMIGAVAVHIHFRKNSYVTLHFNTMAQATAFINR